MTIRAVSLEARCMIMAAGAFISRLRSGVAATLQEPRFCKRSRRRVTYLAHSVNHFIISADLGIAVRE